MHELDAPRAPEIEAIALASLSDAGRVRSENQDAIALIENTSRERLILVADGMGGHRGGETASRICVQMVERVFREPHGTPPERLRRGLDLANEEIYSHALANPELRGMGTTVVVALIAPDGNAWLAWVGDSRCYRLRAGALTPLTRDHSLMSEWISIGVITPEAAETHPRRHELTRALGQSPDVPIEIVPLELAPGDRLLFCSDGLHGCLNDRALRPLLARGTPEETAHALVDAANGAGGSDNVSVVVLDVTAAFAAAAAAKPAPELAPEPSAAPAPEPGVAEPVAAEPPAFELAHDSAGELSIAEEPELVPPPALLPDLEPVADLTADIAAELTVAAPAAAVASEAAPAETSAFELNPEFSFADLDEEIASVVAEPESAREPEAREAAPEPEPELVPAPAAPREPEFLRPSEQQIQIPLMTPVRARRGRDVNSILAGVGGTLLIVALGLGFWFYTGTDQEPEKAAPARPRPAVVRTPPPAPVPKPIANAAPAPKPAPAPAPKPAAPAKAAPARPAVEIAIPKRVVEPPAPKPVARSAPAAVPAAPDGAAIETAPTGPAPSARGFELPPKVTRFVDDWLRALASHDREGLEVLGFADEVSAFAGVPGSREGFRLIAADIDEERSVGGRVYLRMVVSYAFRDASGRFRTQDEQRFILRDVGGRLRYEGRWQQ